VISAAGPHAGEILQLWWVTLTVCLVVFAAVLAAFVYALWRGRRGGATERGAHAAVVAGVALSTIGLLFLIGASVSTDRALEKLPSDNALQIEVIGHKWWWEARYTDPEPSQRFTVANELHIPVGRPVRLTLKADDVIHSFWVPNLAGKKDLIPGREGTLVLRADKPGTYHGQCAEFCGAQHAKMSLQVVAEAPDAYEAWASRQRQPAVAPADDTQRRGRDLFEKGTCSMCHSVQGTSAQGRRAPDLTHFASRGTIGAGAVPNTRGHLAGWILDPHSIKPGVNMPANPLSPDDLHALLSYLVSLR
jgi:cytochrome c oxidase subunit II